MILNCCNGLSLFTTFNNQEKFFIGTFTAFLDLSDHLLQGVKGFLNFEEGEKIMEDKQDDAQFREVGKGFIVSQMEGIVGRILTKTYEDRKKRTYVKIDGMFIRLTEKHCYLDVN